MTSTFPYPDEVEENALDGEENGRGEVENDHDDGEEIGRGMETERDEME